MNIINKIPNFIRWIIAIPIALLALSLAQGISLTIFKILFELNKLQIFNSFSNSVNYFLVNAIASWAFLFTFYMFIPKKKFILTFILGVVYALLIIVLFCVCFINNQFNETYTMGRLLEEDLGIISGLILVLFALFSNEKEK